MGSIFGGLFLSPFLVLELLSCLDQEFFKYISIFLSDISETFQILSGSFGGAEGLVRRCHEFFDSFDLTLAGLGIGFGDIVVGELVLVDVVFGAGGHTGGRHIEFGVFEF